MMQHRQIEDPDWVLEEYISLRNQFYADKPDDYVETPEDKKRFQFYYQENASVALLQYDKLREMMSA